jgi:hypothetical protein
MNMQICKEHEEALILMASGIGDASASKLLCAHIDECEPCRTELDRLRRILSAIEDDSTAARMPPPQTLHVGLMKRLRAEAQEQAEGPRAISWVEAIKFWVPLRRRAWALFALGAVGVVILLTVRWVGQGGKINSRSLAKRGDDKPGELDRLAGQPAGPAELRRSLVHSFEDFETVLRGNDRVLAMREPVAVPSNARQDVNLREFRGAHF